MARDGGDSYFAGGEMNQLLGFLFGIFVCFLILLGAYYDTHTDPDEGYYCYQVWLWHKYGDGKRSLVVGWPPYKGETQCKEQRK